MKSLFSGIISIFGLCWAFSAFAGSDGIKSCDLCGAWYPDNPAVLSKALRGYLDQADPPETDGEIIGLICPHAGLDYSGPVAGYGFKAAAKRTVNTVVVAGFSHRLDYDGIAVFCGKGVKTPLGLVLTDEALAEEIAGYDKKIFCQAEPFKNENSVELILPFIQTGFKTAKVVLLAMGRQSLDNSRILGEALYEIFKGKNDFLLIASTDMSHYLPGEIAFKTDADTAAMIREMDPGRLFSFCAGQNRMCGAGAVTAVMIAARKLGADKAVVLNQSDSSQTGGGRGQVVGYLSAAFVKGGNENKEERNEERNMDALLNEAEKKALLKIARETLDLHVTKGKVLQPQVKDAGLKEVMGVFVTLHKHGQLRGCIGNIVGREPLYLGVRNMAIAASAEDPRFSPVKEDELGLIDIEISVLSPLKKVAGADEIEMGRHGVVVQSGWRSGVFLPQVAEETGWSKEEFLNSLCAHKAGLPEGAWKTGQAELYVFTAEVFGEKD